jgi:type VI secretion system protein ImpA
LRQDPNVILVGEIRDQETAQMALSAAETGHLVFTSLHTRDAKGTITRYADLFPQEVQRDVRAQLAMSLRAIISQRLLPGTDKGAKRHLALEVLWNTHPIASAIRSGKVESIDNYLLSSRADGMASFDESLRQLLRAGKITREVAEQNVRAGCVEPLKPAQAAGKAQKSVASTDTITLFFTLPVGPLYSQIRHAIRPGHAPGGKHALWFARSAAGVTMPSPQVLDFAKLLTPIPGEKRTGTDLRADPSPNSAYYVIKDARSTARAAERQLVLNEDEALANRPDWRPVLQHGTAALAEKSKDLEITAYMIEALVRQQGFPGLRDGFRLAREMVEQYWDEIYPLPDEDGLETRVAALTGLNGEDAEGTLIVPIAKVPITDKTSVGALACTHYQEAVALGKMADPKARDKKLAQGAISMEAFQKAVGESSPTFFVNLVDDIKQCSDEYGKLCAALDQRCNGRAPPTANIRAALAACLDTVKDVARHKLEAAPAKDEAGAKDGAAALGADGAPAAARANPDVIQTREEAFRQLLKVAEFFRRTEPHTPVSYALEQVVRWGRMPLPELLAELIPEEASRKNLFKQVGIKPPEPPPKEAAKK